MSSEHAPTTTAPETFVLSQALTEAAQHAFSTAHHKGLMFLYDYVGEIPTVIGRPQRLRSIADHMLGSAVHATHLGAVFFLVDARRFSDAHCLLRLRVADTDAGLEELDDEAPYEAVPKVSRLALAANLCRSAGGRFWIKRVAGEGSVLHAELGLACTPGSHRAEDASADGAQVWLVGDPLRMHQAAPRRLLRLNWTARVLASSDDALVLLDVLGPTRAPALLIGYEPYGVGAMQIEALRRALPDESAVVWAVDVQHSVRAPRGQIAVHAMPMDPLTLLELTEEARTSTLRPSGDTQPAPLSMDARARVLVVDDHAVNRILAQEMLQALGYEVDVACDGVDAVEYCEAGNSPSAVLMDVSMPRMDGLAATRKLRQLQRQGSLARFPILATTAHCGDLDRQACELAGMDAMCPKPIDMQVLADQLAKWLAEYARTAPPGAGSGPSTPRLAEEGEAT